MKGQDGLRKLTVKVEGVAPLMFHNKRLCDPLDSFSRALARISGKRKKTESDHAAMSEIEWFGGIYTDPVIEWNEGLKYNGTAPVIPAECIEATIVNGAKVQRLGKSFTSAFFVQGDAKLAYDGPQSINGVQNDKRFVDRRTARVGQAKIMRTRPRFPIWSATFSAFFLPDVLNLEQVERAIADAGRLVGFCDWRPKFGRYNLVSCKMD